MRKLLPTPRKDSPRFNGLIERLGELADRSSMLVSKIAHLVETILVEFGRLIPLMKRLLVEITLLALALIGAYHLILSHL